MSTPEKKKTRLLPATKEKKCSVCGERYTYPSKGSNATRHKCESCADLPPDTARVFKKLTDRINRLESQLTQFTKKN